MKPKEDRYCLPIEELPEAFAYHRIITDRQGNTIDYIYLDVNEKFLEMTGLSRNNVISKKATEVFPGIEKSDADLLETYGNVARSGSGTSFGRHFKLEDRWYEVTAYSDKEGFFAVIFHDTTSGRKKERDLLTTARLAEDFLRFSSRDIDYQQITDHLLDISGSKYIAFNLYDANGEAFTTMALSGISEHIRKASSLLGFPLVGKKWPHDPVREEKIRGQVITRFPRLSSLVGHIFPQKISSLLEKTFQVGEIILVQILREDNMIGDFTIIMAADRKFKNEAIVEIFTRQVGLLLTRKQAEEALLKSEKKLKAAFEGTHDGITIMTKEGKFLDCNRRALELFGLDSKEEFRGKLPADFSPLLQADGSKSSETARLHIKEALFKDGFVRFEWLHQRKDGNTFPAEVTLTSYTQGEEVVLQANLSDITERKFQEEKLLYLSMHDVLTGLYNRAFFEEEVHRLSGSREYPVSIIVADVDDLKQVNDTMGHAGGDALLKACANVLHGSLRDYDILARIGGDEFAVLLPRTEEKVGKKIMERIRLSCAEYNAKHNELPLSISMGMATAERQTVSLEEVLIKADNLMYREKLARKKENNTPNQKRDKE